MNPTERRRRTPSVAIVAALTTALVLSGITGAEAKLVRRGGVEIRERVAGLVPKRGSLFGSWVNPRTGWSMDEQKFAIRDLERKTGRQLDVNHFYYAFDKPFPTWREPWSLRRGGIPMISWNGTSAGAIAGGRYDTMIRQRADAVRELGAPVILRFFWEMDGKPELIASPSQYIKAWRHVHDIFVRRGATNAAWSWCPNGWAFTEGRAQRFYPGKRYVDWLCADGYNWFPGKRGSKWRSFAEIFTDFYRWGVKLDKPMMVGETGVQEDRRKDGRKRRWFLKAKTSMKRRFPKIRAFVYFHSDSIYPWWVDSSPRSLSAFGSVARSAYFRTRGH
ncbi:MAG: glycosyl hydrolase [Actinomycetota bacterium]